MVTTLCKVRLLCRAALLLCALSAAARSADQAEHHPSLIQQALKFDGQVIRGISFYPSNQPLPFQELLRRLPFATGTVFHEQQLREAIQALFATGRFADIAVDAAEEDGGVALRFSTRRAYFVGHISINRIKLPPNAGQLYGSTKLRLGTPYVDSDRNSAVASMLTLLHANGLYHAKVRSQVDYETDTNLADLTFTIEEGDRARFEMPVITGDPKRSEASIVRATHWQRLYGLLGWHEATNTRVRQGIENIRNYYEKRDMLRSRVTLSALRYHSDSNRVQPVIDVHAGPQIRVSVEGARIRSGKLKQLLPIYQERTIDADLLVEGEHNIESFLQNEGYFEAAVTYRLEGQRGGPTRAVVYDVDRGERHKFVHLEISGNTYFPTDLLREQLSEIPAELPRYPFGRFSSAYLRSDVQVLRNLYVSNGFREAKITTRTQDDFRGVRNHLAVFVHIDEGPQTFVATLSIAGASAADLQVLHHLLATAPGQPFSAANVLLDREHFLNYYYDRGYPGATFEYRLHPDGKPNRIGITYLIHPGARKFVRDVLVTGLETTRAKLVFDRIELKAGEPLSLAKETESQRKLYDLGIFARVNTALENPDGDEVQKYVLYDIDEARHYSLNVGVGAQIARIGGGVTTLDNPAGTAGFAPRMAIGITRDNFLGLGQTIGLQTLVSTIEQRAAATYFIPQFVAHDNLSLTTTALLDNSIDIRTFTAHRREASIQLGERLSRAYSLQYRLTFRHVTQSNLKIDPLLVPLLAQPETVGLTEVSLIQDKRDDPTDAHHGIYTTLDIGYAPRALGSQTEFGRVLFRNSTYHQFHRDLVLARSNQIGWITRTGGRASIPLAERLYSGGSTSLRAFPDFQAGPRDLVTGFPLGGNALFTNNTELRFPLMGDNLGGVLFHDAGNVYDSFRDFSIRFRQRNLEDFNYMVQDVGFGIRYRTPIGPLRVDLSISPNAPRFFGLKGTLQDYLNGNATSRVQKINAFQFHISLGQAF